MTPNSVDTDKEVFNVFKPRAHHVSAEEIRESKSLPCVEWLRVSPIASFVTRTTNYCTKLRNSTKKRLSAIRKTTSFATVRRRGRAPSC